MDVRTVSDLQGDTRTAWEALLSACGLSPDTDVTQTVLVYDGDELVATGSRKGRLLKCIATTRRGEDLTATVLTELRRGAFCEGLFHLFLYTKPQNQTMFEGLLWYPVVRTKNAVLMEDRRDGIRRFLDGYPVTPTTGEVGALVMNCDPFTLGHRFLIETAAKQCEQVYVFVLSEDESTIPAADRLQLVRRGTADLANVTVLESGPYMVSTATFPTYFLPDRDKATVAHCDIDVAVFSQYIIPHFGITRRFVGEEPLSPLTAQYNAALKASLPIPVVEIPRLCVDGTPVSASAVRRFRQEQNIEALRPLVPATTFAYLTGGQ